MKFLKYLSLFLVIIMLAGSATPVFAQDYIFQVPEMAVVVSVNEDGSINIDYTMTFLNDGNAHEIDIVDIGLPNYNYNLKSISAEVNGNPIKKITASDIVSPGISVYLQDYTIPPGGTGTVGEGNVSTRGRDGGLRLGEGEVRAGADDVEAAVLDRDPPFVFAAFRQGTHIAQVIGSHGDQRGGGAAGRVLRRRRRRIPPAWPPPAGSWRKQRRARTNRPGSQTTRRTH